MVLILTFISYRDLFHQEPRHYKETKPWLAYLSSLSTCDAAGVEVAGVPGAEEPSEVRRFLRLSSRGSGSGDKMKSFCVHIYNFAAKHQYTRSFCVCVCVEILKSNMVVRMQASTKQIETNCVHIYNFTAKCQYRHARLKFQCVCVC